MHCAIQWYVTKTTFGASLFNEVMTVYKKIATSCSPHLQIAKAAEISSATFFPETRKLHALLSSFT